MSCNRSHGYCDSIGIVEVLPSWLCTPDFKWQGSLNGGKNQNQKNSQGLQTKPPKNPSNPKKSAEFLSHKNLFTELRHRDIVVTFLDCFEYPKNPYLNQATQKNIAKVFQPWNILKLKISNPQKSFDYSCHLKSRSMVAWPVRSTTQMWVVTGHQYGISALVSQMSFHGETRSGIAVSSLFSGCHWYHQQYHHPPALRSLPSSSSSSPL